MTGFISSLSTIWRLAVPYFRSEDRWPGRILLAAVIATELSLVGITVLLNQWYNSFYNSLQERNWDVFVTQLIYYLFLAAAATVLQVYQLYLNQWLQIRWRRWMTKVYLDQLAGRSDALSHAVARRRRRQSRPAHCRRHQDVHRAHADHRCRAAQRDRDARLVHRHSLDAFERGPVATCSASRSADPRLPGVGGAHLCDRGHGVHAFDRLAAGRCSTSTSSATRPISVSTWCGCGRIRSRSPCSPAKPPNPTACSLRFGQVVANWHHIMLRQKQLTFFTTGYTRFALVFPFIVVSPAYFAGVHAARRSGADRRCVRQRRDCAVILHHGLPGPRRMARGDCTFGRIRSVDRDCPRHHRYLPHHHHAPEGDIPSPGEKSGLTIEGMSVRLPTGAPLVATEDLFIKAGERALVTGPSGCGKSTLLPGHRRRVAIRQRRRGGTARRQADDAAAAALFPDCQPGSRSDAIHRSQGRSRQRASPRCSTPSACPRWPSGSRTRRTGIGYCRSASSSASASPARFCKRRTIYSWTRPPRPWTSRRKPGCTGCCRNGSRTRQSCRLATARR